MLIEHSSDLILSVHPGEMPSGQHVDLVVLVNHQVLVISADTLALYKNIESVGDELGNGFINSVAIPAEHHLQTRDGRFLQEHKAGYAGLSGGYALLIGLNTVQMFASKTDALHGHDEVACLPLHA